MITATSTWSGRRARRSSSSTAHPTSSTPTPSSPTTPREFAAGSATWPSKVTGASGTSGTCTRSRPPSSAIAAPHCRDENDHARLRRDPAVIVVCGEALIDIIPAGDDTRRPVPGGGPFNTARALARLGAPTAFLGRLSTDAFGVGLANELVADGADLSLVSYGPEPTTLAVAELDGDGLAEYEFYVHGTSAPNLTLEMVPAKLPAEVNALHIGTLGLVLEPMATTLTEVARREGEHRLLMVDPNVRPQVVTDAEQFRGRLDRLVGRSTIAKASEGGLAWL